MTHTINKNDWIEIQYTGFANGQMFDSNDPEQVKKMEKAEVRKTIISVGNAMVVRGLDHSFTGKQVGEAYKVHVIQKEGFGERNTSLIKTIPLKQFTAQQVFPHPGMAVVLDNSLARIVAVSGARVITDFNNPLAGKDLDYEVKITRLISDHKEQAEAFFDFFLKFVPEFEIGDTIKIKGPKPLEYAVTLFGAKFQELVGKKLTFELVESKPIKSEQQSL
jgi:FKBP-type peptidyl-prolyl cis-trans isomerase SlyD